MSDGENVGKVRCIFTTHTGLGSNEEILNRSVICISAPSGRIYEFEQAQKGAKFSRWIPVYDTLLHVQN